MLNGAIGVSRSDPNHRSISSGQISQSRQRIPQVGVKGNNSTTFLLCNPIFEGDDSSNIPPTGSVTMSHVRLAISPARRPAFTDSKTMTRFRVGYRVRVVKARRSRMLSSDKIFPRLPSMIKLIVMMTVNQTIEKSNTFCIGDAELRLVYEPFDWYSRNSLRSGPCPDRLDCQRHRTAWLDVGSRDALCQRGRGSAKTSFGAPPLITWIQLKSPAIEFMSPAQVFLISTDRESYRARRAHSHRQVWRRARRPHRWSR